MTRRGAYALLAFGIGAVSLALAAKLLQKYHEPAPERLAEEMKARLWEMQRSAQRLTS